jgi:hypothetical protein
VLEKLKRLINLSVPTSFQTPLFYQDQSEPLRIDLSEQASLLLYVPFVYDIANHQGIKVYKPWEDREESVRHLLSEWEINRGKLSGLFNARNRKEARPVVIVSIAYFLMGVFWVNRRRVEGLIDCRSYVSSLDIKPVNCVERLSYILNSPDHYHSFIQLTQLFEELNKQFQKALYMKRK